MPYTDPKKQAEAQRGYRRKNLKRAREAERKRKQVQRAHAKHPQIEDLDRKPTSCFYHFFAEKPCRKKARWHSPTGARWCDEHAKGADFESDLVPIGKDHEQQNKRDLE